MAAAAVVSQACVSYEDSIHDLGLCNNPVHCCTTRLPDQEVARAGCTNLLLCQHPRDALRDLNQYLSIKASDPGHTDAYILCPHLPHAPWSPQTKGMVQVACLRWSKFCTDAITPEHDSKFVLWYDPCRASPGCVPTARLPAQVQTLLTQQPLGSQLTFVFEGKVAGIRGSILWDSGVARSFISRHFVRLHKLGTSQSTTQVQLADGSVVESAETATLKLHVQGHRTKCTFIVIDMIPGFDVVLGDDWSTAHQVTACYGRAGADGTPSAPFCDWSALNASFALARTLVQLRLRPNPSFCLQPWLPSCYKTPGLVVLHRLWC